MSCLKLLDEELHVGLDDFAGSLRFGGVRKGWRCCWFSLFVVALLLCVVFMGCFSLLSVWLWLRSDTPWSRPTPARGSKCNAVRKSALKRRSRRDRRKRIPGDALSIFQRLARAWGQSSLAGLVYLPRKALRVPKRSLLHAHACQAETPITLMAVSSSIASTKPSRFGTNLKTPAKGAGGRSFSFACAPVRSPVILLPHATDRYSCLSRVLRISNRVSSCA